MRFQYLPTYKNNKRMVVYTKKDCSFDMNEHLYSDFTLMLGCSYLGLDVLIASAEIVNISGFCHSNNWISRFLCPPAKVKRGTVKIIPESDLCGGTGMDLFYETPIFFDESKNLCYIEGNETLKSDCDVQIFDNVVFSMCGQTLVGVWIYL